jgi:murein DD-endopeptidase MepM/ murein hydrolase activator NlpD
MAIQLILGLGKAFAKKSTRKFVSQKIKQSANKKEKNLLNSKKGKDTKGTSIEDTTSSEEESSISRKKITPADLKIKSASSSETQIVQLKINVKNIHSFLLKQNRHSKKVSSENKKLTSREASAIKLNYEVKKFKSKPIKDITKNVKKSITSSGNILDNIMEFATLILLGICVNALPKIVAVVKETIDNIVEFITPIQSGFELVKAWFTGDLDHPKYDADKKRLNDSLKNVDKDGGYIDQLADKLGPFGIIVRQLKPLARALRGKIGGSNVVLAKEGGKEGFYNIDTETFTERQWTSSEREEYQRTGEGDGGAAAEAAGGSGSIRTSIRTTDSGGDVISAGETNSTQVSGYPIRSHYGRRTHPVTGEKGKLHPALDVGTPEGTAVALSHPGVITSSFLQGGVNRGYGNMIDAWVPALNTHFRFAHLKERLKAAGEKFKANEILGYTGGAKGLARSGSSTGPHLHLEVDNIKGGKPYGGGSKSLTYEMSKHVKLGSRALSSESNDGDGSGGLVLDPIKPMVDKYPELPSNNISKYYYLQPQTTIRTEIISFPVSETSISSRNQVSEISEIWEQ